ncbi:MAG: molybdopterin-binding protein, partial [Byssovorax sp.]
MRTAAALIIGNELLSGKIAEANLVVLARTLRPMGILLRRVVMILDEIDVIAHEVSELSSTHDVVFTSGGVGPTHDDLTIQGVAQAFGAGVTIAKELDDLLRAYYAERITEGHLLMARVPEGARLVSSGTVQWPTVVMKNVWVLPGVPEIFKLKMPLVRDDLGSDTPFISMAVFTDLDEGQIKDLLDRTVTAHASVEIGSYPKWNDPE